MEPIVHITLNGERCEVPAAVSVAELLKLFGFKPEHVAVEINKDLITRSKQAATTIAPGDVLEVVTLVGGGSPATVGMEPLSIGTHVVRSRLLVGTGKYASLELMRDSLEASGAEIVTVAVRRERLVDREGRNLLDYLDPRKYTILPNTAGCFSAEDALRTARLGASYSSGWRIPAPTGSNLKSWPTHEPSCPIRSPRWKRLGSWSKRDFRSFVIRATTRSWPAGSKRPAPPASCLPVALSAAAKECSIPTTSGSSSRT